MESLCTAKAALAAKPDSDDAAFPVDAAHMTPRPSSTALATPTALALSFRDAVGFRESSLIQMLPSPVYF